MSKQPAKQPARKEDTLKPGQYLEADNVIIRYMGPKNESGKYEVRVEDKFGRKKPTDLLRLSSDGMRRDDTLARAQELLKKQPDQPFKLGRFTVTPVIKSAAKKEGGRKTRRKKKHRRKTRRKHKTKRKRKRKRKTKRRTRKKRGRGISPSRMAKGTVAALAASEMMKQGSAIVSPQGRAVQQQLRSVNCDTIAGQGRQLIKPLHPDHGGTDEDFRAVYGTLTHRRGQCKLNRQRGDTGQDSKPKPKRRDGESAKKARQRENRERRAKKAKQQEEQAKAKARTERQQEADARAGRQQQPQQRNTGASLSNIATLTALGVAGTALANAASGRRRRPGRLTTVQEDQRGRYIIDRNGRRRDMSPGRS